MSAPRNTAAAIDAVSTRGGRPGRDQSSPTRALDSSRGGGGGSSSSRSPRNPRSPRSPRSGNSSPRSDSSKKKSPKKKKKKKKTTKQEAAGAEDVDGGDLAEEEEDEEEEGEEQVEGVHGKDEEEARKDRDNGDDGGDDDDDGGGGGGGGGDDDDPYYRPIDKLALIRVVVEMKADDMFHRVPSMAGSADNNNGLFELENGQVADGKFEGEEMLNPQTKLQLILRKAFEYRMLNSFEARDVRVKSTIVTSISLLLSGVSSILLLTSYSKLAPVVAATLSAVVSALTGYSSLMQYTSRFEQHASSVKVFANLQRDVMGILRTMDDDGITESFNEIAEKLSDAVAGMPLVEPGTIDSHRDRNGERYFTSINHMNRWNESVEDIVSMKDLDIFTGPKPAVGVLRRRKHKHDERVYFAGGG